MKPSSRSLFFRIIFFSEIILIGSGLLAFLVHRIMVSIEYRTSPSVEQNRALFANTRVLKSVLDFIPSAELAKSDGSLSKIPIIQALARLNSAASLLAEKKHREAKNQLEQIISASPLIAKKKHELLLRYYYSSGQYSQFIKSYKTSPPSDLETKILLINSHGKLNDFARGFLIFKELFSKNKLAPFKKLLAPQSLNRFLRRLDSRYWYKKFNHLTDRRQFSEIFTESRYGVNRQLTNLFQAEYNYYRGNYRRCLNYLTRVKDNNWKNHRQKLEIKIRIRRNQLDDITEQIEALKDDMNLYPNLLYDCATLFLMKQKYQLAEYFFSKYIGIDPEDESKKWRALWICAWINYKANQKKMSVRYFKKGLSATIDSYLIANHYWYGKLKGKHPSVIPEFPFTYYYIKTFTHNTPSGWEMDSNRFQAGILLRPFRKLIQNKTSSHFLDQVKDLKHLLDYRLVKEARGLIDWAKNNPHFSETEKNMFKLMESIVYYKIGDHYHAYLAFRKNFPDYQSIILPRYLAQLSLPIKFKPLVEKYSRIHGVDPLLVYALIRQESFFNPTIKSPANAYGLMQLIPSTARAVARGQQIRLRRGDIVDPEINIRLGTDYLKRLLRRYSGEIYLTLAAYNAGIHRVNSWLKTNGKRTEEEFIEMIPFTETRSYVKTILRNYFYYRYYYGFKTR